MMNKMAITIIIITIIIIIIIIYNIKMEKVYLHFIKDISLINMLLQKKLFFHLVQIETIAFIIAMMIL